MTDLKSEERVTGIYRVNVTAESGSSTDKLATISNSNRRKGRRLPRLIAAFLSLSVNKSYIQTKMSRHFKQISFSPSILSSQIATSNPPFSHLQAELTSRRLPRLDDDFSRLPSRLLAETLKDFLPESPIYDKSHLRSIILPFAHHIVYFPPPAPLSSLLPDGTEPLHSPGPPFHRGMWAGGSINLNTYEDRLQTGVEAVCQERIRDVAIKGREGEEKIYVTIERSIKQAIPPDLSKNPRKRKDSPISGDYENINELRNFVFLRNNTLRVSISADASHAPTKNIKSHHQPDISHTLIPTAALLFRFSALTFNAHAIHLDKDYCREVEGHRNLLVHGPLSLILMIELLRGHLANLDLIKHRTVKSGKVRVTEQIQRIEYRNIAPLYAGEEMNVCVRKTKMGEWQLWIEGFDGRLAVRATARTFSNVEANY